MNDTYTVYQDASGNILTIVDTTTWESFPPDPSNASYVTYEQFLASGGIPTIQTM